MGEIENGRLMLKMRFCEIKTPPTWFLNLDFFLVIWVGGLSKREALFSSLSPRTKQLDNGVTLGVESEKRRKSVNDLGCSFVLDCSSWSSAATLADCGLSEIELISIFLSLIFSRKQKPVRALCDSMVFKEGEYLISFSCEVKWCVDDTIRRWRRGGEKDSTIWKKFIEVQGG